MGLLVAGLVLGFGLLVAVLIGLGNGAIAG